MRVREAVLAGVSFVFTIGLVALAQDVPPPTTGPTTGPATGPSTAPADAGPAKPSRDKVWVSGTVLHADGKPATGVEVRAEKNEPMGMGAPNRTGPRVYRATTDENGNFLFKEMDDTMYILVAGNSDVGWIYQEIPVKAGTETKLGTLKLTKLD